MAQSIGLYQVKMSDSATTGGGDVEAREKARKRGRPYQCLHCFHKEGKKVVDVKGRLEEHILRHHRTVHQAPFYCNLCFFKCLKWAQLNNHTKTHKPHTVIARKANIVNDVPYLMQNPNPHKTGPMDYYVLSAEESLEHFMRVSKVAEETKVSLPLAIQQCFPAGFLNPSPEVQTVPLVFSNASTAPVPDQPTSTSMILNSLSENEVLIASPYTISINDTVKAGHTDHNLTSEISEIQSNNTDKPVESNVDINTSLSMVSSEINHEIKRQDSAAKCLLLADNDNCGQNSTLESNQMKIGTRDRDGRLGNNLLNGETNNNETGSGDVESKNEVEESEENDVTEDIREQLLGKVDSPSFLVSKRALEEEEDPIPVNKKMKQSELNDICEKSLVTAFGNLCNA